MVRVTISHRTVYRYITPVNLAPHRIMLRPRESRDLRILSMELHVEPQAAMAWAQDIAGNAVATAVFESPTDNLIVHSAVEIELNAMPWPIFAVAASAIQYPFQYSEDERLDLGALLIPQFADPEGRLHSWVQAFVRGNPTDTLALLKDINAGILLWMSYQSRDAEGTQSPLQSLERTWGSCRDLAVLFIEAVRMLGFGARIVSGYIHDPLQEMTGAGAGSTHAWAEVYVPGAGWIAFDPTNRSMGGANLIPVAVGRHIQQVMPLTGDYFGTRVVSDMSVEVSVSTRIPA